MIKKGTCFMHGADSHPSILLASYQAQRGPNLFDQIQCERRAELSQHNSVARRITRGVKGGRGVGEHGDEDDFANGRRWARPFQNLEPEYAVL